MCFLGKLQCGVEVSRVPSQERRSGRCPCGQQLSFMIPPHSCENQPVSRQQVGRAALSLLHVLLKCGVHRQVSVTQGSRQSCSTLSWRHR